MTGRRARHWCRFENDGCDAETALIIITVLGVQGLPPILRIIHDCLPAEHLTEPVQVNSMCNTNRYLNVDDVRVCIEVMTKHHAVRRTEETCQILILPT